MALNQQNLSKDGGLSAPLPAAVARSVAPESPLEDVAASLRVFAENDSLYCLELPKSRWALFRIDGVIVEISEELFGLLENARETLDAGKDIDPSGLVSVSGDARDALLELGRLGFLGEQSPRLKNADPYSAEPGGILLMMTQTCNLACSYCYAGGGTYGGTEKLLHQGDALQAIDLMLERAPSKKRFTINFFGGEPLINFAGIRQVVDYTQQIASEGDLEFSFTMTTNGTIVNDEIIEFLKEHTFTLMISYDGAGQVNRPFKGGESSKPVVLKNLERLKEAGVSYQVRATLTPEVVDKGGVGELVQLRSSLGVDVFMSGASETKNQKLPANRDQALDKTASERWQSDDARLLDQRLDAARNGDGEDHRAAPKADLQLVRSLLSGKARGMGKCGAGLSMVAASTNGKLYPCHRFVGMDEYVVGSIEDGVDNDAVRKFFLDAEESNKANCSVCFARSICGGMCFYEIADRNGGFSGPEKHNCDALRDRLRLAIATVIELQDMEPEEVQRFLAG